MTAQQLVAFYGKHKDKLVTVQLECGDVFERVWMESCVTGVYEGQDVAVLYTATEGDPTKPTHAHPVDAINFIEGIE